MSNIFSHVFNTFDYLILGSAVLLYVLLAVIPQLSHIFQSTTGKIVLGSSSFYLYLRWQFLHLTTPQKTQDPTCEEKIGYFRNLRNVYLDFSVLVVVVSIFWVSKLKVDLEKARSEGKQK